MLKTASSKLVVMMANFRSLTDFGVTSNGMQTAQRATEELGEMEGQGVKLGKPIKRKLN
jgi:hypothetical protein